MAKVLVGDTEYVVPPLNFMALEKAWKHLQRAMNIEDTMVGVSAAVEIVAAGIQEADYFKPEDFGIDNWDKLTDDERDVQVSKFLKRKLAAKQIGDLQLSIFEVIEEAGLLPSEGELRDLLESLRAGTGIALELSPNLLPPAAREAAGTQ